MIFVILPAGPEILDSLDGLGSVETAGVRVSPLPRLEPRQDPAGGGSRGERGQRPGAGGRGLGGGRQAGATRPGGDQC